jgi:Tfp pilus assembly protein PilO
MNKISKEKRDQMILVCLGTLVLVVVIYFFWINKENAAIRAKKGDVEKLQRQYGDMTQAINTADATAGQLRDAVAELAKAEADMASNDPNAWAYDLIRHFEENYKVTVSVNGGTSTGDVDLLPGFPYKQLRFSVSGSAYYHDLGEFIAAFENNFPHIRITNLSIDPLAGNGDSSEKLSFRMDITALVKPNEPQS